MLVTWLRLIPYLSLSRISRNCAGTVQCLALLFPKPQILNSFKLKEFADYNFKFDEDGRKSLKKIENIVGKGEIARYEQFLLFSQCFQNTCTADT